MVLAEDSQVVAAIKKEKKDGMWKPNVDGRCFGTSITRTTTIDGGSFSCFFATRSVLFAAARFALLCPLLCVDPHGAARLIIDAS